MGKKAGRSLTLQSGEGDGAHEVFWKMGKTIRGGVETRDGAGHDGLVVGAAEAVGHAGNDEGEGQLLLLVEDDEGPQVGVEGAEEDEDGERGEERLGQGQVSVAIDAEVAAAVDLAAAYRQAFYVHPITRSLTNRPLPHHSFGCDLEWEYVSQYLRATKPDCATGYCGRPGFWGRPRPISVCPCLDNRQSNW